MDWLQNLSSDLYPWLAGLLFLFTIALTVGSIVWVLMTKTDATSAVAWCLVILMVPYLGAFLFVIFGYQHVHRPLKRKRRHMKRYRGKITAKARDKTAEETTDPAPENSLKGSMQRLAERLGGSPLTTGNRIDFYHDSADAFDAMLQAIKSARHHVHLEYYIVLPDELGRTFIDALAAKAREKVEVRLLYDAMGTRLPRGLLKILTDAGVRLSPFLPISPLRRRVQVNMRNHRKILVIDGSVAFTGGLNIGDEYIGRDPYYGYWRDTHLRLEGPGAAYIQAIFCEDWDFAAGENLQDVGEPAVTCYFPRAKAEGDYPVQVLDSGPDRDVKAIREAFFAAISKAQRRVWIASPYFIPDAGILDAIKLAAYMGVDVRLLGQFRPDHWIPLAAAQFYFASVLEPGVKVYQYSRGMMHSKVMIVDDDFASVGSANMDNRSLHLNFELTCLIYSAKAVDDLAAAFEHDFRYSIQLDAKAFAARPFSTRLVENACRLLSPVL